MIRVSQATFMLNTRALFARAREERKSIEVVDEAGEVRSIISLGTGEAEADPDDVGAEVQWAVCIGVIALGEWASRQRAKHAARAFVATQPGYECVCCAGTGIRPASGRYAVTCECGAEHPIPRILDALIAKHATESEEP